MARNEPRGPFLLGEQIAFPPPRLASDEGLLGVGGDLSPPRLLTAYATGIFPWFNDDSPILWWSPDPRFILWPEDIHIGRSLRQRVRSGRFEVRLDTAFADVIQACAEVRRAEPAPELDDSDAAHFDDDASGDVYDDGIEDEDDGSGTWITADMEEAYTRLHALGFAHSAESWRDGELVGGLYGVSLGSCFFGESMFFLEPDASKVAFAVLLHQLVRWGFTMIDCQMPTEHLRRFGARDVPRADFLRALDQGVRAPTRRGRWTLEVSDREVWRPPR